MAYLYIYMHSDRFTTCEKIIGFSSNDRQTKSGKIWHIEI